MNKLLLRNTPIRLRLIVYFTLLSTIPIIAVGFISFTLSLNNLKASAIDFSTQSVNQTSNEINDILQKSLEIGNFVSSDPSIQEMLRNPLDEDISKRYSKEISTNSNLNFMNSYMMKEVFGIYVLGENGGQFKSNSLSFKFDDMRNTSYYDETIKSDKPIWFTSKNGSSVVITISGDFFSMAMPIKDKLTGNNIGIVVIDLPQKVLIDKIANSQLGNKGFLYMMNNGEFLFSENKKDIITSINYIKILSDGATASFISSDGIKYAAISNSTISGWKVVGLISIDELEKESRSIAILIIIITLLVSFFAVVISIGMSTSVAKPIKELMKLMKKAEKGDLTQIIDSKYNDEIGQLFRSYGHMIVKLNELMHKIYEDQQKLRKAQLAILQSQINPHFLYNTLDSVIWMARDNKNEEVVEMVMALTKLLRVSLSKGRDLILIEDEIMHVESYLKIQKIRYKGKFEYKISIPENAYKYYILKLSLQPIVENAIYHGIKNCLNEGLILIDCMIEKEKIIFIVSDTGVGIPKEKVDEINIMLKDAGEGTGFGLRNVNERMKISFGTDYGLMIESTFGIGTKVTIMLPLIEVDSYDKNIDS